MRKIISVVLWISILTLSTVAIADEWTCPTCGNEATLNFCNKCGTANPSSDWICPKCKNEASGNFCNNCGSARPTGKPTESTSTVQANDTIISEQECNVSNMTGQQTVDGIRNTSGSHINKESPKEASVLNSKIRVGINYLPITDNDIANGWPCKGLLITNVAKPGPAYKAGLVSGDIIIAMNDFPVKDTDDLSAFLETVKPDTLVKFTILHASKFIVYGQNGSYTFDYSDTPSKIYIQLEAHK